MVFTHYTECGKIVGRCGLAFNSGGACSLRGRGSEPWGPAGHTHTGPSSPLSPRRSRDPAWSRAALLVPAVCGDGGPPAAPLGFAGGTLRGLSPKPRGKVGPVSGAGMTGRTQTAGLTRATPSPRKVGTSPPGGHCWETPRKASWTPMNEARLWDLGVCFPGLLQTQAGPEQRHGGARAGGPRNARPRRCPAYGTGLIRGSREVRSRTAGTGGGRWAGRPLQVGAVGNPHVSALHSHPELCSSAACWGFAAPQLALPFPPPCLEYAASRVTRGQAGGWAAAPWSHRSSAWGTLLTAQGALQVSIPALCPLSLPGPRGSTCSACLPR